MSQIRWDEVSEVRQLARLGKSLSRAAQTRLQWMLFYLFNGRSACRICSSVYPSWASSCPPRQPRGSHSAHFPWLSFSVFGSPRLPFLRFYLNPFAFKRSSLKTSTLLYSRPVLSDWYGHSECKRLPCPMTRLAASRLRPITGLASPRADHYHGKTNGKRDFRSMVHFHSFHSVGVASNL
jgi:hypothetical protein